MAGCLNPLGSINAICLMHSECFSRDHDDQGVETSASSHKASPQRSRSGTECTL